MIKGFTFGKFLPFHKGHESMIRFGLTQCDHLTVLVCCSDMETIPGDLRCKWITETLSDVDNLSVVCFNYLEQELVNSSVASRDVSREWSAKFVEMVPMCDVVITSEEYGDYVAEYMGIKHILYDADRTIVPISATKIRGDITKNWGYVPDAVKRDLSFKIVILGTESTGKSTLAKKLSELYGCALVDETGREFVPDSNIINYSDLVLIANEHAKRIDQAVSRSGPMVIIDTDIHITASYCEFVFGTELDVPDAIYESNKSDLYLYLANDVEHVQDGTRLSEDDRNLLDISHRNVLRRACIDFIEISGPSWSDRLNLAICAINHKLTSEEIKINPYICIN